MSVLDPFICLIDNAQYEGFGQGTWIGKQTELTRELMVIFLARQCSPISRTLPALSYVLSYVNVLIHSSVQGSTSFMLVTKTEVSQ